MTNANTGVEQSTIIQTILTLPAGSDVSHPLEATHITQNP